MTNAPPDPFSRLPFLTRQVSPIDATIKRRYEDFRVTEIPLYEPADDGTHCYLRIEKTGLATMRAVNDIARALGKPPRDIGVAGLKDARGVTVQTVSIEHVDPAACENLSIPRIRVLSVRRHGNKLRIGHLRGNRFEIRMRDIDVGRLDDIQTVCGVLARRGVPNYFGRQRFGLRGDTWEMGRAILKRDFQRLMDLMLGRAGPDDHGEVLRARQLYDSGDYEAAVRAWPRGFRDNARACRALARGGGNPRRAYHGLEPRLRRLFVNALQSRLFNDLLARRIDDIDRVADGDVAYKHDSGATFRVDDAERERERVKRFEISPTGPIFGPKMKQPGGNLAAMEAAVLAEHDLRAEEFDSAPGVRPAGDRRPLRFLPSELKAEPGADGHGPFLEMRFVLPPGCYATMLLREICKDGLTECKEPDD